MRSNLFNNSFQEKETNEKFAVQSKKMLRVHLQDDSIVAASGSMVAYQGSMKFGYKGSNNLNNFFKKSISGENNPLMSVHGSGDVFLARNSQEIFNIILENDSITVSGESLLAFDNVVKYDIRMMKSFGAAMSSGLFNIELSGVGNVAITSDGTPILLDVSEQSTFVDPQAVVCWSSDLNVSIKNDVNIGSFFGRSSGEGFQMGFSGDGFVVVQPSERLS